MNEQNRVDLELEDLAIVRALESLEIDGSGALQSTPYPTDARQEALRRRYVEILGLLPEALEPIAPGPEVEAGLMARILADRRVDSERHSVARMAAVGASSGSRGWILPLAAVLALLMVGATFLLSVRLGSQQDTIDSLAGQLQSANARIDALSDLQSQFSLVTQAGVEICALRPAGAEPAQPGARAALYVAPDHSRWYLVVEGLAPPPDGHAYQVWFSAADGPVSAGLLENRYGERVELAATSMPAGTNGVFITVEQAGGQSVPTGNRVLYGDEVMQVL